MTWSLSRISTYERCPAKYKYRYMEKLPEQRGQAAERGVAMHKEIELYLKGEPINLSMEMLRQKSMLDELKDQNISIEHRITLDNNWTYLTDWDSPDAWLHAILDLKVVSGQQAIVYDWKSGKVYPEHNDQKVLYALAVLAEHPEVTNVAAIHTYLDLGKNTRVEYHRDQMDTHRKLWAARVHAMENDKELMPNPNYLCRWCAYSKAMGGPCRF